MFLDSIKIIARIGKNQDHSTNLISFAKAIFQGEKEIQAPNAQEAKKEKFLLKLTINPKITNEKTIDVIPIKDLIKFAYKETKEVK